MQPELEALPFWHEASTIVRESCRVPAEIIVLPPVLTFFALILGLFMQIGVAGLVLDPFRRMLGRFVLDAQGNVIGMGVAPAPAPPCAADTPDAPAATRVVQFRQEAAFPARAGLPCRAGQQSRNTSRAGNRAQSAAAPSAPVGVSGACPRGVFPGRLPGRFGVPKPCPFRYDVVTKSFRRAVPLLDSHAVAGRSL
jgi:hypothetical protein